MSGGPAILVVDDDDDLRDTIADILTEEGYSVAQANNGAVALEYLKSHPDTKLILIDLMMPIMDGRQFRAYQRIHPPIAGIPVVFLSAGQKEHFRAPPTGDHIVAKPITVSELLAVVALYAPLP